ncbi:MAG: hypothetical protein SLAVMIC_00569 [uncultured marine phage]|uniref:Uncharacterized protein n=1 Tax=uncultured marine phage TaxID=707152 RepID=A0A8D9FQB9_9VIRU|nr:MAG: hypothetical protein SLAVMIC_00569 [uncultured marine phage]
MKYIKLYEEFDFKTGDNNEDDFISNDDFLIENDWEEYIPNLVTVKKGDHVAKYELGNSVKNLNSINLDYSLKESDTETIPNKLNINISFKMKNDKDSPMDDNSFNTSLEVTMGTLYIMGIKISDSGQKEFMEGQAEIDSESKDLLLKLIDYISGKH